MFHSCYFITIIDKLVYNPNPMNFAVATLGHPHKGESDMATDGCRLAAPHDPSDMYMEFFWQPPK